MTTPGFLAPCGTQHGTHTNLDAFNSFSTNLIYGTKLNLTVGLPRRWDRPSQLVL